MTDHQQVTDVTADASSTAEEIPSRYLPGVPYADLPDPLPLKRIIGPSVILLAASIGSGEFVLWPFITSEVGLVVIWMAVLGVVTQFFINMEIERYTLATGETAVTGFTRLWKGWAPLFIVMTIVPWAWPGWATGASTMITFVFGGGSVVAITIAALVALGVALTASPVVYQLVEKLQTVLVVIVLLFIVAAIFIATGVDDWGEAAEGVANFGQFANIPGEIAVATLLGALAFAGAGGTLNLTQSNWIRDKGMGMGARIPRIVSPVTGKEEAAPATGFFFPQDEPNLRRWRGWWRVANLEHALTFLLLGVLGIVALSVLTFATVEQAGRTVGGEEFEFIRSEGEALKDLIGGWFGTLFWIVGAIILFSTNLGVLDMVGRVTADILKINWLRDSQFWSESKLYFAIVWAEIAVGSIILLSGLTQPLILLVIAAALNGLVMFVYSILLIDLNHGVLPKGIRVRGVRLLMMIWAAAFFGYFSIVTIIDQFGQL